jgi:hypothetical protein
MVPPNVGTRSVSVGGVVTVPSSGSTTVTWSTRGRAYEILTGVDTMRSRVSTTWMPVPWPGGTRHVTS